MSLYGVVDPTLLEGIVDSAVVGMDVTDDDLRQYIERFKKYPETSVVVVNFYQGQLAMDLCEGSHVEPCVVIAYPPLCSIPTDLKVAQATYAVEEMGIPHLLFTIDHAKFSEGRFDAVEEDIAAVVDAVDDRAAVIVMPDFAHWTADECIHLAQIIRDAGGDLIKSTGGMGRVELPEKIDAVVKALEGTIPVMGTSAIRDLDDVLNMLDANPDKIAISRIGFFNTLDEVHALAEVRVSKRTLAGRLMGLVWHPTVTGEEVRSYLTTAKEAGLFGVSVDPRWLPLASDVLDGSETRVVSRVDYPLGVTSTEPKVEELRWIIEHGPPSLEVQVPMNTSAFKSGHYDYVREELDALVEAAEGRPLSVILQSTLLSKAEVAAAASMCISCGVHYVEPVHGFGKFTPDGETILPAEVNPEDIKLLKQVVGDKMGVRATGNADRLIQILVMLNSGAEHVTLPNAAALLGQYEALVKRIEPYST